MPDSKMLLKIALAAAVLLALLWSPRHGPQAKANEACDAVNEVKAALVVYIDQQLDRSKKSLPTIDYYKKHPVELGKALAALERQREETHEAFAPTRC